MNIFVFDFFPCDLFITALIQSFITQYKSVYDLHLLWRVVSIYSQVHSGFWRRNTCRNYNCGWIIMQFLSSPLCKISLLVRTSLCQTKLFRSICSCCPRWMLHSSSELRKMLFCVVASCLVRNCFQVQQSVTFPCNFPTSFHGYVSFAIHLTFFM